MVWLEQLTYALDEHGIKDRSNFSEYGCLRIDQDLLVIFRPRTPLHFLDKFDGVQYQWELHQFSALMFVGNNEINKSLVKPHGLKQSTGQRIINSTKTAFAIVRPVQ